MNNLLEIEKLTISTANGKLLVDNSSFEIFPGEVIGIVGNQVQKTLTGKALVNAVPLI